MYSRYAAWLFKSMSLEDAKEVLGFPPSSSPSPRDIQKAYRALALENHPDRGGSHKKMVEINTAKDILEGKRREDRTPREPAPKDPEVEKREKAHRERIRREMAVNNIETQANKVSDFINTALNGATLGSGRIDIKEFLVDDYAGVLDSIHNEIDAAGSKEKDWLTADALCQKLASMTLRLASKLTSLRKKHDNVASGLLGFKDSDDVTLDRVSELYEETTKFIAAFKALYVESGKLMKLIVTSEKVPLTWDDRYSSSHQIIIAFKNDFGAFNDRALKAFEAQLERSVDSIQNTLEQYKVEADFPDWKQWKYPTDFRSAVEVLRKSKTARDEALIHRIVTRYAASTTR